MRCMYIGHLLTHGKLGTSNLVQYLIRTIFSNLLHFVDILIKLVTFIESRLEINIDIDSWKTCEIALVKCNHLLPKAKMFSLEKKCERSYCVTIHSVLLKRNVCYKVKHAYRYIQQALPRYVLCRGCKLSSGFLVRFSCTSNTYK